MRRWRYSDRGSDNDRRRCSKPACGRDQGRGRQRDVDMTGFSPRLELRQSQTLIMTPQLQQSIKVLQLSNLELTDFIDVEIQQNPLLEWRERGIGESARGTTSSVERVRPQRLYRRCSRENSHPTRQAIGNRSGARMVTGMSILAASRSHGTVATEASMRRDVPGSTRPRPGCAPCASISSRDRGRP